MLSVNINNIIPQINKGGLTANKVLHLTPKSGVKNRAETSSVVAPLFGASEHYRYAATQSVR